MLSFFVIIVVSVVCVLVFELCLCMISLIVLLGSMCIYVFGLNLFVDGCGLLFVCLFVVVVLGIWKLIVMLVVSSVEVCLRK